MSGNRSEKNQFKTKNLSPVPEKGHILKREKKERVKLVNIENLGHFMIYEQPKKVTDEIISLL